MSKLRRRFIPNFDSLENRVVPAGNVTVSFKNNLLSIVGDDEANGISLTNNLDGTFTIDTTDGDTTFNGGTDPLTMTATKLFQVSINMKGGDDTVDVVGGNVTVKSKSSIKLGAGSDTLTVDGLFAREKGTIDGEGGDDSISVTNSLFDPEVKIKGGAGLDNIAIDNVAFAKKATIDAGSDDDIVNINNGRFDGKAKILGGSGIDDITITASRFDDHGSIDAGSGDDTVTVDDTVFFHDFRFDAGSGVDVATFSNSRFDFDSRFKMGSGDDELILNTNFFNKEASYDGGSGFDTFTHDGGNTWAKKHKVKNFELFQLVTPAPAVTATDDAATVIPTGTVIIDVLANDFTDGTTVLDPATVTIVTPPTSGTATVNADGTITYLNTSGVAGTDTFTYTVNDDQGNVSNEATVTIDVSTAGTLTANPDSGTVTAGGSTTIPVLANDTTPAGTTLNPGSVQVTQLPVHGTVVVEANGSITYTHTFGDTAMTDTFAYTVSNSNGDTSGPGTVTVSIDQPLAAIDDAGTVDEGLAATINVAANDTTPIGTTLDLNSIAIVTPPVNGSVVVNGDGTVTYTHNGSETLNDSFTYTIMNSAGNTSGAATVLITVNPINDAPVAGDDVFTVVSGSQLNSLNLALNDTDPEGQLNLGSILIGTQPTQGTVTVNNDGTVTYNSNVGASGTDTFTYRILDQNGEPSNIATVTITITPAP